jgi:murein L,D-transpeptidase YafK
MPYKSEIRNYKLEIPMPPYSIIVEKSPGMLTLYKDGERVMSVPCFTGKFQGPKKAEGDLRTPEGVYRVCDRNEKSDFHLSLGLDYPGIKDAEAAFAEGRIDAVTRDAILAAHASGQIPPWNTPLGGEIYIHGEGTERDWTLGCVKVSNADIERLFAVVPLGTPVDIRP